MTRTGCGSHGSTPAAARIAGRQHAGREIGSHSVTGAGPGPVRKYLPDCALWLSALAIHAAQIRSCGGHGPFRDRDFGSWPAASWRGRIAPGFSFYLACYFTLPLAVISVPSGEREVSGAARSNKPFWTLLMPHLTARPAIGTLIPAGHFPGDTAAHSLISRLCRIPAVAPKSASRSGECTDPLA